MLTSHSSFSFAFRTVYKRHNSTYKIYLFNIVYKKFLEHPSFEKRLISFDYREKTALKQSHKDGATFYLDRFLGPIALLILVKNNYNENKYIEKLS